MNCKTRKAFPLGVLAAASLAAFGSARAADELTELSKPESTLSLGAGYVSDDNHFFGQYTGMNDEGAYGLLDFNIVNRDEESGTWARLDGRNLGREDRELRFEHRRQGDWGYFLEYSQIPRYELYTATTAVTGIGTPYLNVPAVATPGVPVELNSERDRISLGLDKQLSNTVDVQIRVRNEQKSGERLFARGTTGNLFQFTPEPLDSSTSLIEAILGFTGDKLQLSGGYYGSIYDNHNNALNVTEVGGATGLAAFTPIGLPPDNQSHQLYLTGGYSFSAATRSTFKVAYASATQTDNFITPAITGFPTLDGQVDTTQAQLGITSRAGSNLSLLANVRYENRDDKTPVRRYSTLAGLTSTFNGYYEPRSLKTTNGKVEAGYRLPMGFRVVGGVDYESNERYVPYWLTGSLACVGTRAETEEMTYRAQLHRSLAETVNGYVTYSHGDRNGSDYLKTVLNGGAVGSNLIAPLHLADRSRDKVRVSADWTPIERLTLQFVADSARDNYTARTTEDLGPRNGDAKSYTVDANLLLGDTWQATAWVSRTDNRMEQATCEAASSAGVCPNTATDPYWQVAMRNSGDSVGLGLRGQPFAKIELGADVQYSAYRDEFRQLATTTGAVAPVVPDVTTLVTLVRLTAKYAIQRNAGIRLDYNYERWNSDDWQWSSWTYLDGTQLLREPIEKVQYIGVSGYLRWW